MHAGFMSSPPLATEPVITNPIHEHLTHTEHMTRNAVNYSQKKHTRKPSACTTHLHLLLGRHPVQRRIEIRAVVFLRGPNSALFSKRHTGAEKVDSPGKDATSTRGGAARKILEKKAGRPVKVTGDGCCGGIYRMMNLKSGVSPIYIFRIIACVLPHKGSGQRVEQRHSIRARKLAPQPMNPHRRESPKLVSRRHCKRREIKKNVNRPNSCEEGAYTDVRPIRLTKTRLQNAFNINADEQAVTVEIELTGCYTRHSEPLQTPRRPWRTTR